MGSLAFWRALEGAGKGTVASAMVREDSRQKQMQRDYEARMAQLKIQADKDMASERNQVTRDVASQQAAMDVFNTERQMTQSAQQHEERMAGQERATAATEGQLKLAEDQFERERWKVFQVQDRSPVMTEGEGAAGPREGEGELEYARRMMLEGGSGATPYETRTRFFRYDQQEGKLQEQVNGQWKDAKGTLEGPDKLLYENPSQWQMYLERAGFLPEWYIEMYGDPRAQTASPGGMGGGR